jgi:hypothetical protein
MHVHSEADLGQETWSPVWGVTKQSDLVAAVFSLIQSRCCFSLAVKFRSFKSHLNDIMTPFKHAVAIAKEMPLHEYVPVIHTEFFTCLSVLS